jgi:hypothetical protein
MNSLYEKRSIGVLGVLRDERSLRDIQMQQEYGSCGKKEQWSKDSAAGVTEIPAEYRFGFEERSVRDKQMLSSFSGCQKEGYQTLGSCGNASISDNPFNPLANGPRVSVQSLNKK